MKKGDIIFMKKFKIIVLLIFTVVLLFTMILIGCNNAEKAIIGKWRADDSVSVDMAFDFKANHEIDVFMYKDFGGDIGFVEELIYSGKYNIVDNKIEFTLSGNTSAIYFISYITDEEIGTFEYKIKSKNLILSEDGINERIFIKTK